MLRLGTIALGSYELELRLPWRVEFVEWTQQGQLRHARFVGMKEGERRCLTASAGRMD